MNVEMKAELIGEGGTVLLAHEVRDFVTRLPDGATVGAILRDFGTQRDPEVTLVGLRATWSETR